MDYEMSYSGPEVILPIGKYGTVRVCFTDGGHAAVSSNSSPRKDGAGTVVTQNGEHWYLHLSMYSDFGWDENPSRDHHHHQGASQTTYGRELPVTWRAKIVQAVQSAISSWVAEHPDVLNVAARNNLDHHLERQERELAEAEETVRQLKAGRIEIIDALLALPELS